MRSVAMPFRRRLVILLAVALMGVLELAAVTVRATHAHADTARPVPPTAQLGGPAPADSSPAIVSDASDATPATVPTMGVTFQKGVDVSGTSVHMTPGAFDALYYDAPPASNGAIQFKNANIVWDQPAVAKPASGKHYYMINCGQGSFPTGCVWGDGYAYADIANYQWGWILAWGPVSYRTTQYFIYDTNAADAKNGLTAADFSKSSTLKVLAATKTYTVTDDPVKVGLSATATQLMPSQTSTLKAGTNLLGSSEYGVNIGVDPANVGKTGAGYGYEYPGCSSKPAPKCTVNYNSSAKQSFQAYVYEYDPGSPVPHSLTAPLVVTSVNPTSSTPVKRGEQNGRDNPSEPKTTCSCGDPVNTATGAYTEQDTDLAITGRGPELSLVRSFDSSLTTMSGVFGKGWVSSYDLSLSVDPSASGALATAAIVDVNQENGSTVAFARQTNGSYTAPGRVEATLTQNSDGTWTFVRGRRTIFAFTAAGVAKSIGDLDGNTTTFGRNASGQIATATDGAGRTFTFNYTAGLLQNVRDSAGRSVAYTYDTNNRLSTVTDPNGNVTTYGYDSSGRVTTVKDPRKLTETTAYGSDGRVSLQSDHNGNKTTYSYSAAAGATNDSVTMTDPAGNVTVLNYVNNEILTKVQASGTALEATTTYAYDPNTNQVSQVTDPEGLITSSWYDAAGDLIERDDPSDNERFWSYDALGDETAATDALGVTTKSTYSATGDLQSQSTPLAGTSSVRTTTYAHDDSAHPGDVTANLDPDGNKTSYTYDSFGQASSTTDPDGNTTTNTYSCPTCATNYANVGLVYSTVSARGNAPDGTPSDHRTTNVYDADGELITTTDPLGRSTTHTYDADGEMLTTTDANRNTTTYSYDRLGHTYLVTRPSGVSSGYLYNWLGQLVNVSDPNDAQTTYTYDALGRVSTKDAVHYTYDLDGNLLTTATASGSCTASVPVGCTTNTYDADGELESISYSDGTPAVQYDYDADGNQTTMTDGTGRTTNSFDSLGRLTSTTDGSGDTVGYRYDLAGRRTGLVYPNGKTVTDTYDAAGRMTKVTDWNGKVTNLAYDPDGGLVDEAYPNAMTSHTTFDATDAISSVRDSVGATTLASFTYSRGSTGMITAVNQSGVGQTDRTYAYNADNQLTNDTSATPNYSYDDGGNLLTLPSGASQSYDSDEALIQSDLPGGSRTYYAYDRSNNRRATEAFSSPETTDNVNLASQLTRVTTPAGVGGDAPAAYYLPTAQGQVFTSTAATAYGSPTPKAATSIVGLAATPDGTGYWLAGSDGTLYARGGAPKTAMATAPTGTVRGISANPEGGYYMFSAQGGVFNSADAPSYGGPKAGTVTNITGMAVTENGGGYWLVGSDGTLYNYGNAPATGTTATSYAHPIAGIVSNHLGGYYKFTAAGDVYPSTNATSYGSPTGVSNIVGMTTTADGKGYWLAGADGRVYNFGDAPKVSTADTFSGTAVGIAAQPNLTTFTYDGDGVRMTKTTQNVTSNFVYDASTKAELVLGDGSNYYVYGPSSRPIEQIDAATGATTYLAEDQLGSVRLLTDAAGTAVGTYSFDAYGNTVAHSGTVSTPLEFGGQYYDGSTGLYWMRARYYDPSIAEFISPDPLAPRTGSLYQYAADNPVNSLDPLGLCSWYDVGCDIGSAVDGIGHVASAVGHFVQHHYGTIISLAGGAACIVVSAGSCALLVLAGGAAEIGQQYTNGTLSGSSAIETLAFTGVGLLTAGVGGGLEELANGAKLADGTTDLVSTGAYTVITRGLNGIEAVPTALLGEQELKDPCP